RVHRYTLSLHDALPISLIKLIAYSSLTGTAINVQMAQQVLKHLVHAQERRVTMDSIQKAVADRFQIKQSQLKEKSNTKKVVYPRSEEHTSELQSPCNLV